MKTLLLLLATILWAPLATAQEGTNPQARTELLQRLKALQQDLKTATTPEEREQIQDKITKLKKEYARLSGAGKKKAGTAPPKPDPRAELQGELNRLYREFKETKDPAERAKIRNDIALVMGALKKLSAGEGPKPSGEAELPALKARYAELMKIVSDPNQPKEARKKAKGDASDIRKRIEALQGGGKESPKKKTPKKPK